MRPLRLPLWASGQLKGPDETYKAYLWIRSLLLTVFRATLNQSWKFLGGENISCKNILFYICHISAAKRVLLNGRASAIDFFSPKHPRFNFQERQRNKFCLKPWRPTTSLHWQYRARETSDLTLQVNFLHLHEDIKVTQGHTIFLNWHLWALRNMILMVSHWGPWGSKKVVETAWSAGPPLSTFPSNPSLGNLVQQERWQ